MSHVAIIIGLSGRERYLGREGEVAEKKKARKFRSPGAAECAAQDHLFTFKPVVQRGMSFRIEPFDSVGELAPAASRLVAEGGAA